MKNLLVIIPIIAVTMLLCSACGDGDTPPAQSTGEIGVASEFRSDVDLQESAAPDDSEKIKADESPFFSETSRVDGTTLSVEPGYTLVSYMGGEPLISESQIKMDKGRYSIPVRGWDEKEDEDFYFAIDPTAYAEGTEIDLQEFLKQGETAPDSRCLCSFWSNRMTADSILGSFSTTAQKDVGYFQKLDVKILKNSSDSIAIYYYIEILDKMDTHHIFEGLAASENSGNTDSKEQTEAPSSMIEDKCPYCHGSGKDANRCAVCNGAGDVRCTKCGGDGQDLCTSCGGDGDYWSSGGYRTCSRCSGHGYIKCTKCGGDGMISCSACHGSGGKTGECRYCFGTGRAD